MRRLSPSSLRVRLLVLVLLALLPAFGLILYTAFEQRRQTALDVQDTALRLARLASSDHGRLITGTHQLFIGLAQLPAVRSRNARECNELLARLMAQYPLYANIGAIDPEGHLYCSGAPIAGPVDLADRAYFRRALATRTFAVGEYQIGRVTGKATINVGYPVLDGNGRVEAVLFAALDLSWLNQFVAQANLPAGSTVTVVDQKGTILVRHPDASRWVGQSLPPSAIGTILAQRTGVAEASGLDGVERLFGFAPLLGTPEIGDVYLSIGVPVQTAFGPANRGLARNLGLLGVVALLALGAAWVGGDVFVLRQVNALVDATRRLAAGDLTVRTGVRGGTGEVDHLARAFDEMAAALERDTAERERTHHELQRQREALHQNEKLAALGRLAAGVAHELKNPLAVIAGRVELFQLARNQGRPPSADQLAHSYAALGEAAERMKRIMTGLSIYSKPSKPAPTRLDVTELVSAVRELVAYQARTSKVLMTVDAPAAVPPVLGDRSQLMQVLLNLATNAVEAMAEGGGELTLRTRVEAPGGPLPGGAPRTVVVEVADTGPGISEDQISRIWDAFYTTKAEGTGLGLSIVRSLVEEQPGATIAVESAPGRGTTFRVAMPAVEGESPG